MFPRRQPLTSAPSVNRGTLMRQYPLSEICPWPERNQSPAPQVDQAINHAPPLIGLGHPAGTDDLHDGLPRVGAAKHVGDIARNVMPSFVVVADAQVKGIRQVALIVYALEVMQVD